MISDERLLAYRYHGMVARTDDYPPKDGLYQDYLYFQQTPIGTIQDAWRNTVRLIKEGKAPDNIILYLHWPFCLSQCTYCFCSMTVSRDMREWENSTRALIKEMDAFKDILRDVQIQSIYLGGGTPTYATEDQLDRLFKHIYASFNVRAGAEVYVESSPATLTRKKMDLLRRHGVNRMTMGLQTRDDVVLRGVNRNGQDRQVVERAWEVMAATEGILYDLDLMVGLEGQDRLSFVKDLLWSIKKEADVIHIQSFDPRSQTQFSRDRKKVNRKYWGDMRKTIAIAGRILEDAGYGMTHFDLEKGVQTSQEKILSDDPFELASVLALGKHGKSHAFGGAWYQHPPVRSGGFNSDRIPHFQYIPSDLDEEMRCYVIRSLCMHEKVSLPAFRKLFGRELNEELRVYKPLLELAQWGKVRMGDPEIRLLATEPADRLVWLKHLYREDVIDDLLEKHADKFNRFKKDYREFPDRTLGLLRQKAESRTYHMVYYKGFGKKKETSGTHGTDTHAGLHAGIR